MMTMKTIEQVCAERETAGAAYVAAAKEYLRAFVELHAHDLAIGNASVGGPLAGAFAQFQPPSPHGEFLPDPLHGTVVQDAYARHEAIVKSVAG